MRGLLAEQGLERRARSDLVQRVECPQIGLGEPWVAGEIAEYRDVLDEGEWIVALRSGQRNEGRGQLVPVARLLEQLARGCVRRIFAGDVE